jgi:hypothetical protein
MQLVMGLVASLYDGDMAIPTMATLPWVVLIGIAGLTAHFCLTTALSIAPASIVMPMDFARLPAIAVVGMVFYDEPLAWGVAAGCAPDLRGQLHQHPRRADARDEGAGLADLVALGDLVANLSQVWVRSGPLTIVLRWGRIDHARLCPHFLMQVEVEDQAMTQFRDIKISSAQPRCFWQARASATAGGVERNPQTTAHAFRGRHLCRAGVSPSSRPTIGVQVLPVPRVARRLSQWRRGARLLQSEPRLPHGHHG